MKIVCIAALLTFPFFLRSQKAIPVFYYPDSGIFKTYGDPAFKLEDIIQSTSQASFHFSEYSDKDNCITLRNDSVYINSVGYAAIYIMQDDTLDFLSKSVIISVRIGPKPIIVKARDIEKLYGDPFPELSYYYDGLAQKEDSLLMDTPPKIILNATINAKTEAGLYNDIIKVNGAEDENYLFNYQSGDVYIKKRVIEISASGSSVYGDPMGLPEYNLIDLLLPWDNLDSIDVKPSYEIKELSKDVGEYEIWFWSSGSDNNYKMITTSGTYKILPAKLTIMADTIVRKYGEDNPELSPGYIGLRYDDKAVSVLESTPELLTNAKLSSPVGDYEIFFDSKPALSEDNHNYYLHYVSGVLRIEPADFVISTRTKSVLYGNVITGLDFDYDDSQFRLKDNIDSLDFIKTLTVDCNNDSPPGKYPVYFPGGVFDNNYNIIVDTGFVYIVDYLKFINNLVDTDTCKNISFDWSFKDTGANTTYQWELKHIDSSDFSVINSSEHMIPEGNTLHFEKLTDDVISYEFRCLVTSSFYKDSVTRKTTEFIEMSKYTNTASLNLLPTPPFAEIKRKKGTNNMLISTEGNAYKYQWGFKEDTIYGENRSYVYVENIHEIDQYWVLTYYDNGCSAKTFFNQEDVRLHSYVPGHFDIQLSPNPSEGMIDVDIENLIPGQWFKLTVRSFNSNIVFQSVSFSKTGYYSEFINLGNLTPGFYFIEVNQGSIGDFKKLIIK